MGKYMKKPKITANVLPIADGVCTRAKSLALKRSLQSDDSSSYIELRSRRRLKKVFSVSQRRYHQKPLITSPVKQINQLVNSPVVRSSPFRNPSWQNSVTVRPFEASSGNKVTLTNEAAAFTGDGNLNFLTKQRVTSGIRCSHETNHRRSTPTAFLRDMPSFREMEAFFAAAEREQQRKFMNKYNFDIVAEKPIHGGYEWFRISQ